MKTKDLRRKSDRLLEECAHYPEEGTDRLPARVKDILLEKANRLDSRQRSVAETLSLFPKPVSFDLVRKVMASVRGQEKEPGSFPADTDILIETDGEVAFRHDGIREAMYKHIRPSRRKELHRAVHAILLSEPADDESIAYHAAHAGKAESAAIAYERAAMKYKAEHDYGKAMALFSLGRQLYAKAAKAIPLKTDLAYAECLGSAGRTAEARKTLRRIVAIVPSKSELKATIYRHLGACSREPADESVRFHALAISHLPTDSPQLPRFLLNLAQAYAAAGKVLDANRILYKPEKQSRESSMIDPGWSAIKGSILVALCNHAQALELLSEERPHDVFSASVLNNRAVSLEHLGRLTHACCDQHKALALSRHDGLLVGELQSFANLGAFETKRGNFTKATSYFAAAERFCDTMHFYHEGGRTNLPLLAADQAVLQMEVGQYALARKSIASATRRLRKDCSSQKAIWVALRAAELYGRTAETPKARDALRRVEKSELFQTDFFRVEQALVLEPAAGTSTHKRHDVLNGALLLTETLGTLYQRCRVLIELATTWIEEGRLKDARACLIQAQKLARRYEYAPLKARIAMLRARATENDRSRGHYLTAAYRLASVLPLPELMAECAFRIAEYHLAQGNRTNARKSLMESISTIETLAARIPTRPRSRYLKFAWRKEAQVMLKDLNRQAPGVDVGPDVNAVHQHQPLFKALYEATASIGAAANVEDFVNAVTTALSTR